MGSKVWVVGLDGSNVGYQALRLATMLMDPIEDKIEVLHICLPDDDIELATRLARNAEIELRRGHVHPLRFKICNDTLREPRSCQEHERRIGTLTCTPHALRHCGTAAAAAAAATAAATTAAAAAAAADAAADAAAFTAATAVAAAAAVIAAIAAMAPQPRAACRMAITAPQAITDLLCGSAQAWGGL